MPEDLYKTLLLPIALGMLERRWRTAFAMAMTRLANILSVVFLDVIVVGAALREKNLTQ